MKKLNELRVSCSTPLDATYDDVEFPAFTKTNAKDELRFCKRGPQKLKRRTFQLLRSPFQHYAMIETITNEGNSTRVSFKRSTH